MADRSCSERGSILLTTMIAIVVFSIMMASLQRVVSQTRENVKRMDMSVSARVLAEEAVEDAFWDIRNNILTTTEGWREASVAAGDEFTRTLSNLDRGLYTGRIYQKVTRSTASTGLGTSYFYTIEVVSEIEDNIGVIIRDGLSVELENLASLFDIGSLRLMDNARHYNQIDQIGSYDHTIDKVLSTDLYSYDSNLNADVFHEGKTLQEGSGLTNLTSYESMDIYIGEWGHAPPGSDIPYISYFSRDLLADGGNSDPVNIYYSRRSDVQDHPNSVLAAGDGKTFFDFATGANESESQSAAITSNGTSDFDEIDQPSEINSFLNELVTNELYEPDSEQFKFIETGGAAPSKEAFAGRYEHTPIEGGSIKLNNGNPQIDSSTAESGAGPTSATIDNSRVLISAGDSSLDKPVKFEVTSKNNIKGIVIESGSYVILYFNQVDDFKANTVEVRDGGKLTIHLGPELKSFNATSLAAAHSGDPSDLQIIDEPKPQVNRDGDTYYDGTDIALGDPYRKYEPYKALNLDNANHPTVASIYAPNSTVYTDHFAGVVVAEHYQTHGVVLFDRHTIANNFYLTTLITNSGGRFATLNYKRKADIDLSVF